MPEELVLSCHLVVSYRKCGMFLSLITVLYRQAILRDDDIVGDLLWRTQSMPRGLQKIQQQVSTGAIWRRSITAGENHSRRDQCVQRRDRSVINGSAVWTFLLH